MSDQNISLANDDKIVGTWEGVSFTERQLRDDRLVCSGQVLRRHRNGGGWVPLEQDKHDTSKPYVAETAYIGPFSMVFRNARVTDNAQMSDNSWAAGNAQMSDNAQASDNARLFGDAQMSGNDRISGNERQCGDTLMV